MTARAGATSRGIPRSRLDVPMLATYALLGLALLFVLFPIYWMVATSLKLPREILRQPALWPQAFDLRNYRELIVDEEFLLPIRNSLLVADSVTLISVSLAALAAYSLVRFRTPENRWTGTAILMAYLMPVSLLFIPLSIVMARLQLSDSIVGLIVVYLTFSIPLATWMLQGFFRGVPRELEEQAMIDGMSRLGAFVRVVLPLSAPGLAAVSVIVFTGAWNEMLLALVLISSEENRTAPIALNYLITSDVLPWGPLMAGAVLSSAPLMILDFVGQRFMVHGLADGSVKG